MINYFIEDYTKFRESGSIDTSYIDQNILNCFIPIVKNYEAFGYDEKDLLSQLEKLGSCHISYLLPYLKKELKQSALDASLKLYSERSKNNKGRREFLNVFNIQITNPIEGLFESDFPNINDYNLDKVFELLSQNEEIQPGLRFFKYAAHSEEIDKFLIFFKGNDTHVKKQTIYKI